MLWIILKPVTSQTSLHFYHYSLNNNSLSVFVPHTKTCTSNSTLDPWRLFSKRTKSSMEVDTEVNKCGGFDDCFSEGGVLSNNSGSVRDDILMSTYTWEWSRLHMGVSFTLNPEVYEVDKCVRFKHFKDAEWGNFLDSPVVKTPYIQCRGRGFHTWLKN